MRIGLLSDSHENSTALHEALTIFSKHNVHRLIHCGDIGDINGLQILTTVEIPVYLVSGNMDQHIISSLYFLSKGTNVTFEQNTIEFTLKNGKKLAASHGDNAYILNNLVHEKHVDYVCHGHTHRISDSYNGNSRIICPGAVCGPRFPSFPTVAILDSDTDELNFYDINNPSKTVTLQGN